MSGNLLSENATITCVHGGQVTFSPSQSRVQVRGRPVATLADSFRVTGCPFTTGSNPHPCTSVNWQSPATRVRVLGSPALLQSSIGLSLAVDQAPQGTVQVSVVQQEVVGK